MISSKRDGLIQVYTGKGRGKTTSAAGQAVRALGHNLNVGYVTFFKGGKKFAPGIVKVLRGLGIDVRNFCEEHPSFGKVSEKEARESCLNGLNYVRSFLEKEKPDLVILDEIIISLRDGFVKKDELESFLDRKPEHVELVLTGRGAPDFLIERANLVSRIECVKHPGDEGIIARQGFDY